MTAPSVGSFSRLQGPSLPEPRHQTIAEALAAAARSPDGLVFVDLHEQERCLSWQDIHTRALRCADMLVRQGVTAGDRVALILPTCPGFVDVFFGVLLAGAVPVPLYPPVRIGRFDEYRRATAGMLTAVGTRLLVTDARTRALLGEVIVDSRPELGCRTAGDLLAHSPPPTGHGNGVRADLHQGNQGSPDGLALIQFSSGSTAAPRPVALTNRQVLAQCEALRVMMSAVASPPRTGVSWLPLYHDMGLIGCLLVAVTVPGNLVLLAPEHFLARPALWLRAIARHRAEISPAPSFAFAVAARRIRDQELAGCDLSCWQLAPCGAEPISPQTMGRFAERFARYGFDAGALQPVYGLAEAALAVTSSPPGRGVTTLAGRRRAIAGSPAERRDMGNALSLPGTANLTDTPGQFIGLKAREIVSVGFPIAGHEIDVRSEDGRSLTPGEVGTIVVRGPSVMAGYFGQPAATAAVLRDGWLDTGDVGLVAGGELFICGRRKDIIIINGLNRHPQEFEACLTEIPGLRPGCAVALGVLPPGGEKEELLILAERARSRSQRGGGGSKGDGRGGDDGQGERHGSDADILAEIRDAVRERTGVTPGEVVLLAAGTLPRTSSGKQRRSEARRRYLDGALTPPARVGPSFLRAWARSLLAGMKLRLGR